MDEHYIDTLGQSSDWHLRVVSRDVHVDPIKGNLADPKMTIYWQNLILSRRVVGLHAGPPCSTWGVARFSTNNPGPRPVRSTDRLWGIDDLTKNEKCAADLGDTLLVASIDLIRSLLSVGGCCSLERPADPGEAFPSIWKLDEVKDIIKRDDVSVVTLNQCRYGLNSAKPTMNLSDFENMSLLTHVSLHAAAPPATGSRTSRWSTLPRFAKPSRRPWSQPSSENNPNGFNTIDDDGDPSDDALDTITTPGIPAMSRPIKTRAPPPDLHVSREGRWRLTFKGTWTRSGHINFLEMRTLVAEARHLARSRMNWQRKHLIITDSAVCLGALGKGRSASPPLLRLCRRWSLFRIVLGMRLLLRLLRHVATDLNFADGPSRGLPVGDHPAHLAALPKRRPVQAVQASNEIQAYHGQG